MVFLLYPLISFRYSYSIAANKRNVSLPIMFSFQKNGNYSFHIKSNGTDRYIFQIGTIEDISEYWNGKDEYRPCENITSFKNLHLIQIKEGESYFSGIIEKDGKYCVNIKSCSYFSSNYEINLTFMNPNSCFNLDDQILLKKYLILIFSSFIFYFIWLINWYKHFQIKNYFHYLITFVFLFKIISVIFYYYELKLRNETDDEWPIFNIRCKITTLSKFFHFFMITFITVYGNLFNKKVKKIFLFLLSFLFSFICANISYYESLIQDIALLVIVFITLIYQSVFNYVEKDENYDLYCKLYLYIIFYLSFTCYSCTYKFISNNKQFYLNVADTIFYISFGYFFRLKDNTKNIYFNDFKYELSKVSLIEFVPSFFTKIEKSTFEENKTIKFIFFQRNSNIEIIDNYAFYSSTLRRICIPSSVTIIGIKAFYNCKQLKKVHFTEDSELKIIKENAFSFTGIEEILIPSNVSRIGDSTFEDCSKLKKIEFKENSKLRTIGKSAFKSTPIEKIIIPSNVRNINCYTFYYCNQLKMIHFEESSKLEIIHENAFHSSEIESISIPSKVKELKEDWCSNIKYLTNINLSINNKNLRYINNLLIGKSNIQNNDFDVLLFASRNLKEVKIPSYIKKVSAYAFQNCEMLEEVDILKDSQLKLFGNNAFQQTKIGSIFIPSSVTAINKSAFIDCHLLEKVEFSDSSQLNIIDDWAFARSKIKTISIPSKVVQISKCSFSNCEELQRVDFNDEENELKIIDDRAFLKSSLISFWVPSKVIKIGENAFSNCKKLRIIEIANCNGMTSINTNIFSNNSNLVIMIPANIYIFN